MLRLWGTMRREDYGLQPLSGCVLPPYCTLEGHGLPSRKAGRRYLWTDPEGPFVVPLEALLPYP